MRLVQVVGEGWWGSGRMPAGPGLAGTELVIAQRGNTRSGEGPRERGERIDLLPEQRAVAVPVRGTAARDEQRRRRRGDSSWEQ